MQQPQADQHHTQAVQFSNQPAQPHMMLCPVQFVYDQQMLAPPDEHVQLQPTYLNQAVILNVQNLPPWIQNRSNMVYMSQPYNPHNMVQNPVFNYQYQPMIMQQEQIRHMIPNLMNQNLVQNSQNMIQNPQTMIQNPTMVQHSQNIIQNTQNMIQSPIRFPQRELKQELPLLTHMLQNQLLRKPVPNQQNEFTAPMQIRPQYQNVRPQMLTVNPMPSNHTCVHHNSHQKEHQNPVTNEIPQKNELPQHLRNQILEGINAKTVFKVPITAMVRPTEYALQNIAPADETHPRVYHKPVMKHNTTNTEPKPNYKRKIRDMIEQNSKVEDVQPFKKHCPVNKQDIADKILVRSQVKPNIDKATINDFPAQNNILNSNRPLESPRPQNSPVNNKPQKEEKLLRNTVYVQARGRVNETKINASNLKIANVKYDAPIQNDTERNSPTQIALRVSPVQDIDKNIVLTENNSQNIKELKTTEAVVDVGRNKSKMTHTVDNLEKTEVKEMISIKETVQKYVLTHVLDGHIIQESNVPFIVQKPVKETMDDNLEETGLSPKETESKSSDSRKETDISSNNVAENNVGENNVGEKNAETNNERETVAPKLPDNETVNRVNEDDPFEHISRATVKCWTVSDVFSHLTRHNWRESARRLRDEEIDGESLLLVNKEQLLHIGICAAHADVLGAFLQFLKLQC